MEHALARFKGDRYLRDSAVFFVASMTTASLNYLLHPVLTRVLSLRAYGDLQASLVISGAVSGLLGLFSAVAVNIFANADEHDHGDRAARLRIVSDLRLLMRAFIFAVIAVLCLASGVVQRFFNLGSPAPVFVVAATIATVSAITMRNAFLTGSRDFVTTGTAQVLTAGGRLVFAAALGAAGFGAAGALAGITLSQAVTYAFVYSRTRGRLTFDPAARLSFGPAIRRELRFGGLALAVSTSVMFLTTGDVLVIKHYFDPETAGMYGGIAIVARIALYAAAAAAGVLQPSIRLRNPPEENRRMLFTSLGLAGSISAVVLAGFVAFPRPVISILIGHKYLALADLLPRVGIIAFASALVGPLFSYHVALRDRTAGLIGLATVAGVIAWCVEDHSSPEAIVAHFVSGIAAAGVAFALHLAAASRKLESYA